MKRQAVCHLPAFTSSQHVPHKTAALMCKSTIGTMLEINVQIYITKLKNVIYTNLVYKAVIPAFLTRFPSSPRFGIG